MDWGSSPRRPFFFNDTATTVIYTLSLHDALPISTRHRIPSGSALGTASTGRCCRRRIPSPGDRKSTRLNSSHVRISYAVFCLKKKKPPKLRPHTSKRKQKNPP